MVFLFALGGGLVALFPGASFLLIPIEWILIYLISRKYNAFDFPSFLLMASAIAMVSISLKGLASFLHAIPFLGQLANCLVAFLFIAALGTLAESYYRTK